MIFQIIEILNELYPDKRGKFEYKDLFVEYGRPGTIDSRGRLNFEMDGECYVIEFNITDNIGRK